MKDADQPVPSPGQPDKSVSDTTPIDEGVLKRIAETNAALVLGDEHDLADNLPKSVEYVRVMLSAYERATVERR